MFLFLFSLDTPRFLDTRLKRIFSGNRLQSRGRLHTRSSDILHLIAIVRCDNQRNGGHLNGTF